jgi:hypothetical protein
VFDFTGRESGGAVPLAGAIVELTFNVTFRPTNDTAQFGSTCGHNVQIHEVRCERVGPWAVDVETVAFSLLTRAHRISSSM